MCNISIFCSDVKGVRVSVIHGEQLHVGLREKRSHKNIKNVKLKNRDEELQALEEKVVVSQAKKNNYIMPK